MKTQKTGANREESERARTGKRVREKGSQCVAVRSHVKSCIACYSVAMGIQACTYMYVCSTELAIAI